MENSTILPSTGGIEYCTKMKIVTWTL